MKATSAHHPNSVSDGGFWIFQRGRWAEAVDLAEGDAVDSI